MKATRCIWLMLGVLMCTGVAAASPVTFGLQGALDSYVKLYDVKRGRWIDFQLLGANTSLDAELRIPDTMVFTLDDNESKTIDFFDFKTDKPPAANGVTGGIGWFRLEAQLAFSKPDLTINLKGSGGWGTLTWTYQHNGANISRTLTGEEFHWNPYSFKTTLSDGNTIEIDLDDGFGIQCDSTVRVYATIKNLGGGTSPVPVPSALILLGAGLLGMAGWRYL